MEKDGEKKPNKNKKVDVCQAEKTSDEGLTHAFCLSAKTGRTRLTCFRQQQCEEGSLRLSVGHVLRDTHFLLTELTASRYRLVLTRGAGYMLVF